MLKPFVMSVLVLACGFAVAQAPAPATTPASDSAAGSAEREARRAEWKAKADARFAEADKDKDGSLDKVELEGLGERGERLVRHFDRVDGNKDGELSRDEMATVRKGKHRGRHAMRGRVHYLRGLVAGMDDDGDKAISRVELGNKVPRLVENFGAIDTDADGKLSWTELQAGHRKSAQARPAE